MSAGAPDPEIMHCKYRIDLEVPPLSWPLSEYAHQILLARPPVPDNLRAKDVTLEGLNRTVATLTDEIKTLKSVLSDEVKDIKTSIRALTAQTAAMSEILGLLLRREMRGHSSL